MSKRPLPAHPDDPPILPEQQTEVPLPPMRVFEVLQEDPRNRKKFLKHTIQAMALQTSDAGDRCVWFTDIVEHENFGHMSHVHRVLFGVVDVREVMRAPAGRLLTQGSKGVN